MQRRQQFQSAIEGANLVLHEDTGPHHRTERKVAHRKIVRRDDIRALRCPGIAEFAVAQLLDLGFEDLRAIADHMSGIGPSKLGAGLDLPADDAGVVTEAAIQRLIAAQGQGAAFLDILAGAAVLAVQPPVQIVQPGQADAADGLVQADPPARLAVPGIEAVDVPAGVVRPVKGVHVGENLVLGRLAGEAHDIVLVDVVQNLGQQVQQAGVLRVGRGTGVRFAVVVAHVAELLAIGMRKKQQSIPVIHATGQGAGLQETLVGAVVHQLQRLVVVQAEHIQVIRRVLGHEADHAANAVAAVQGRGRTANDFGRLQRIHVDVIAAGALEGTDGKAVRHAHAVHHGQDPVAADAANIETGLAEALRIVLHRHVGFVTHDVLDRAHQPALDILGIDHRGRARKVAVVAHRMLRRHADLFHVDRGFRCFGGGSHGGLRLALLFPGDRLGGFLGRYRGFR